MDRGASVNPRKGEPVIYVSEDQLTQVEYLIGQSVQGNHVLFESHVIREAYERTAGDQFSEDDAYGVEHHIENLITQPTLAQKRAYLERLDLKTHDFVVRTYFNIIENSIIEDSGVKH